MTFEKLCEIEIVHGFYNDANSGRPNLQLVPAFSSARSLRNRRIQIRQSANRFTLLGDAFTASDKPLGDPDGPKLKAPFKLTFALTASDSHFQQTSSLHSSEVAAASDDEGVLEISDARKVYYFHNHRAALIDGKAPLSTGAEVAETDQVLLYPMAFSAALRWELTEATLLSHIAHGAGDLMGDAYGLRTVTDPADEDSVQRCFDVDMSPFGSGYYPFRLAYLDGEGPKTVDAPFYLDDQFYGLRPFAVIELYFMEGIDTAFMPLKKTFQISIPEARTYWRYHIVNKHNRYEGLAIEPDPDDVAFKPPVTTVLKTGETATVIESAAALSIKQRMEKHHTLKGTHVETLGIFPFEEAGEEEVEVPSDDEPDASGGDEEVSAVREIRPLPNPRIEDSVWEHASDEEDPEPLKPYSDMYVYI